MDELRKIQSSYKLNNILVKKMTSRTLRTSSGTTLPGCSKLMIAAMIHFSHICSASGEIHNLRVADLTLVLRCKLRSVYNVLDALEERELIKVSDKNALSGTRSITLIGNDYSKVSDYSQKRYLNTNYDFLNYRDNKGYDKFLSLSLYSMRLLLLFLYNYNSRNGYRTSFDNLCAQLQVKKRFRIHKYIQEIRELLPEEPIKEMDNKNKRLRYGSVQLFRSSQRITPSSRYTDIQDTYYLHYWKRKLALIGCESVTDFGTLRNYCCRLCAIANTFLKKKLSLELIENTIVRAVEEHGGILDKLLINDIYGRLLHIA